MASLAARAAASSAVSGSQYSFGSAAVARNSASSSSGASSSGAAGATCRFWNCYLHHHLPACIGSRHELPAQQRRARPPHRPACPGSTAPQVPPGTYGRSRRMTWTDMPTACSNHCRASKTCRMAVHHDAGTLLPHNRPGLLKGSNSASVLTARQHGRMSPDVRMYSLKVVHMC